MPDLLYEGIDVGALFFVQGMSVQKIGGVQNIGLSEICIRFLN